MADNEITAENGSKNFPEAYIRFRTVLDALEMTAMRYFLKDKDEAGRIKRAEELETKFMQIIGEYLNQIQDQSQSQMMRESNPVECPEGFFNCGGCCMAYPCP